MPADDSPATAARRPAVDDHPGRGPHVECLTNHGGKGVPRHCRRGCKWPCLDATWTRERGVTMPDTAADDEFGRQLDQWADRLFSGVTFRINGEGGMTATCRRCGETMAHTNDALYEHVGKHQGEAPDVIA